MPPRPGGGAARTWEVPELESNLANPSYALSCSEVRNTSWLPMLLGPRAPPRAPLGAGGGGSSPREKVWGKGHHRLGRRGN